MTHHPLRIQRKRTKGFSLPPDSVCVTRPGRFGNPFTSAASFTAWLESGEIASDLLKPITSAELKERRQWILANVHTLRGKLVACFCWLDAACHADELARLANK